MKIHRSRTLRASCHDLDIVTWSSCHMVIVGHCHDIVSIVRHCHDIILDIVVLDILVFFWYVLDVLVGSILVSVGSVIGFGAHCSPPQYPLKACLPRRPVPLSKACQISRFGVKSILSIITSMFYYFILFSFIFLFCCIRKSHGLPKIAAHPTCETVRHWNHWKSSPPGALR